ncbi:MAG: phosphoenolpyruvate mutase [Alphaproteobacteria bacterium]|nr:phosphoenolpyruvate mutase [Alphaproteobacteria bacterium]
MLETADLSFLLEAHNGLSAKVVEEAGFQGIWASGLTLSAAMALRDSNEASWTQVLETLEHMTDATSIPILLDGDTGYGNFNNVRRLVRKLCERNVAGVCIEDKLFPKTNSFVGEAQPMADIDEFCGRIKAGKDSQLDDDFVLVARVEALICGHGMKEALRRAEAYLRAGADAILIHSKQSTATEILRFAEQWGGRAPLVIVPTKYYSTPTAYFRQAKISTIIWANHMLRAAITAMRDTARLIRDTQSLVDVEHRIASVGDIFRLVDNLELEEAERRYIPRKAASHAIVLAASRGDLGAITLDRPKCMVDIRGQSLLQRLVSTFAASGVKDITVVCGYQKDAVNIGGITMVENDRYEETGELYSLHCAAEAICGPTVVAYGDVLFRKYILDNLLDSSADVVLAVDSLLKERTAVQARDLVVCDRPFSADYLDEQPTYLRRMGSDLDANSVHGEWMGLASFSTQGAEWLRAEMTAMQAEGLLEEADLPTLFNRLATKHPVCIKYYTGHWLDVDTLTDLAAARNFS